MNFWDHQSLVSKETVFIELRKIQWFFWLLKNFFWLQCTKNGSESDPWTCFCYTSDSRFKSSILSNLWITLSSIIFGIIIRKCFSRLAKIAENGASSENCFFGNKTLVNSKVHWTTSQSYFLKWTTSGKPPVG